MTADELESRMTCEELLEWAEKLKMEAEAQKKATADAKARRRRR